MGYRSAGRDVWMTLTAPSLRGSNGAGHPLVRSPPKQLCWKSIITRKTPTRTRGMKLEGKRTSPAEYEKYAGREIKIKMQLCVELLLGPPSRM